MTTFKQTPKAKKQMLKTLISIYNSCVRNGYLSAADSYKKEYVLLRDYNLTGQPDPSKTVEEIVAESQK